MGIPEVLISEWQHFHWSTYLPNEAGDKSGTIILALKEAQLENVKDKVGSTIELRNAFVSMKGGYMRVKVDQWGKIAAAAEEDAVAEEDVKIDEKLSDELYELVA